MVLIRKMLRITVILSLAASITAESWVPRNSAASDAQIRFAIENKYDTTGPGAQAPEYAYKTYQTLDEAIVAYVNDPDTQLPEQEKNRALHKLTRPTYNKITQESFLRYQPKTVDEYTGYKPQIKNLHTLVQEYEGYKPQIVQQNNVVTDFTGWRPSNLANLRKPVNDPAYYKPRPITSEANYPKQSNKFVFESLNNEDRPVVNENALSLSHLTHPEQEDFDPYPQYSFSYGVHDKGTGDSKSAHETRDGGTVHGYYTFMDADGKQRTVHYTADDKLGFRANVQRTHTNTQ